MIVKFTVLRLLLFLVPLALLLLFRVPQWPAIIIAMLFSVVTSFFLLQRQRAEMAQALGARIDGRRERRREKLAGERTDEESEDA